MNDTDILKRLSATLKEYSDRLLPISPSMSQSIVRWIERNRQPGDLKRRGEWNDAWRDESNQAFTGPNDRRFWKCAHHPVATDNYFSRSMCEHGCHAVEPTWHSGGMSELRETTVSAG